MRNQSVGGLFKKIVKSLLLKTIEETPTSHSFILREKNSWEKTVMGEGDTGRREMANHA